MLFLTSIFIPGLSLKIQIMKKRMIRYKVKKGRVAENEVLVKEVYRQLKEKQPEHFRYITYQLDDQQTFVHIVSFEKEGVNPLPALPAFQQFQADIAERLEIQPTASDLTEIGSYGYGD
jgi:hypothetical protein